MRKIRLVSIIILIITLSVMGVHTFIMPLAGLVIRINGIVMLIDIAVVAFCTVKVILARR